MLRYKSDDRKQQWSWYDTEILNILSCQNHNQEAHARGNELQINIPSSSIDLSLCYLRN